MATTTVGYDKEMPCDKLARLLANVILASAKERPDVWTNDQKRIVRACIKYIAYGTESSDAQRHVLATRPRFIHLHPIQNDLLQSAYMEIAMESPELVAQAASVRELHRSVRNLF